MHLFILNDAKKIRGLFYTPLRKFVIFLCSVKEWLRSRFVKIGIYCVNFNLNMINRSLDVLCCFTFTRGDKFCIGEIFDYAFGKGL